MTSFSLSRMPKEDMICTGCGKDPYNSGTGCLCAPGAGNWVYKATGTIDPGTEKAEEPKGHWDARD
ncbi:unnamed protein product [Symbiodinium natans]|uniref:Uncharacterized protein n=1 Tax=Symbiodinium natans TaxID=878477 RepID=A0A812JB90_9DINO|nr:unnamed protein product [Symbiodinium natans]